LPEHEIASIVWHSQDGSLHVSYVEDEPDRRFGSLEAASLLAEEAGLTLAPMSDGTVRWVRNFNAWPSNHVEIVPCALIDSPLRTGTVEQGSDPPCG
jgi:hypothetical protein